MTDFDEVVFLAAGVAAWKANNEERAARAAYDRAEKKAREANAAVYRVLNPLTPVWMTPKEPDGR